MSKRNSKAFTLIELIGVLVIMAIIALIVTPLVMNIIRKARVSADKRSIDAYGRSIELAIAGYLMDNGSFPTDINQLTIEYSGDEVVCTTTQLNSDSSVYLAGCTVGGRSVEGYTYGKEETITYESYSVGDDVTYNGVKYYVIKDSDISETSVTMLKAEPLTVEEVNTYGVGHINRYANAPYGDSSNQVYDMNGYGGVAYYTSESCGWINKTGYYNCQLDYDVSEVKFIIDTWASEQFNSDDLVADTTGYSVRLITKEEFEMIDSNNEWLSISNDYWTMSQYDSSYRINRVSYDNRLSDTTCFEYRVSVRPVITISKSALTTP